MTASPNDLPLPTELPPGWQPGDSGVRLDDGPSEDEIREKVRSQVRHAKAATP